MTALRRRPAVIAALLAVVSIAALVAVVAGSTRRTAPASIDYARTYVELVHALGARDPDTLDAEGTVALDSPPPTLTLAQIAEQADQTARALERTPDLDRRGRYLLNQLDAVAARARQLSNVRLSWNDELRLLFHLPPTASATRLDRGDAAKRLAHVLPGSGSGAARLAAYDRRFVVAPDRLPEVFARALAECRSRTIARLPLPDDERVSVNYVRGEPWSGFSRYLGDGHSAIDVNVSFPLSVDRVLELACHEGYPGHHVFSLLRDRAWPKDWPERAVMPLFSPDAFLAEGAASWAADLVFSPQERLEFEREILFPLAGLDPREAAEYLQIAGAVSTLRRPIGAIVSSYLAGELDIIEASWALQDEALMASPLDTLRFVNRYRGYALAYTLGRESLGPLLGDQLPSADRFRNLMSLATQP